MGSIQTPKSEMADVAVIGLACRFPGGASNESKFWDMLQGRKSAYSEVPSDRYNINAFHHESADKINTLRPRGGHFLEEKVTAFDAPFFNITAQEAKAMDPTARMLLEVAYEALENGGLPVESLAGSDTSCYVGCFTRDFHEMLMRDAETAPMYAGTGTGFSLLSNRISWFYDFHGPSLTLDTACSSSLVGLHLACQGIRSGESKVAVVSGANLILGPDLALWLSNLHMLSPSGKSKSFSEDADGYGRGEGIATVILKSLADAVRDGDTIRAVIRGSGVNQDGHTSGITLPSSDAQANLIKSTYRSAGLDYSQTPYFEAHGTGTAAGDPLELAAVAKTVSQGRQAGNELLVGSVKSNIGHLEGAAGLAGVIKCILMLENDAILPNIHFDKPSPRIPFNNWKIRVPTELQPWPKDSIRRASVNSFGYGGTNAHVIIDGPNGLLPRKQLPANIEIATEATKKQRLFVFSAHDEAALKRMENQYEEYLSSILSDQKLRSHIDESTYLDNLAFTLSERRSRLDWKTCVLASSIEELRGAISTSGFKPTRASGKPRIAFVFTGQGAQWARMGLELMVYPIFKESLMSADHHLKTQGCEWSVIEELERGDKISNLQLARFSQPLCTIIQVAMVDLLRSWKVRPTGVVGHSSGEIAAAYCCGAISQESAWEISYWRGKICSDLTIDSPELKGAMLAVGLSSSVAEDYIKKVTKGKILVACVNSPSSVTISGDETGIDELHEILKTHSVFCRKLKVQNAYHSHHMEVIADQYLAKLSKIQTNPSKSNKEIKMVSSVTQKPIKFADLGGEYWVKNMVSPVLFSTAVQTLLQDATQRRRRIRKGEADFDFLLEIGPHAALKGPLRQILQEHDIQNVNYHSVLMRGEDAVRSAIRSAGTLFLQGASPSIPEVNLIQANRKTLLDLPSYPWNHALTYWSESRVSKAYRFREFGRHDLLGAPTVDSNELEPKWRHFIRSTENPWVKDHVVHSSILYPGAGMIVLVLEAVHQIADKSKIVQNVTFRNVSITKAIVIPDDRVGVECILQMRRQRVGPNGAWNGWWEFTVFSCLEDQKLEENAFGMVTIQYQPDNSESWANGDELVFTTLKHSYDNAKDLCTNTILPKDFYNATTAAGLVYGPSFQGLTEISAGKDHCCCTIAIADTKSRMPAKAESPHLIHPTTLDIIFHSMFAAIGNGGLDLENAAIPVFFETLVISASLPSGAGAEYTGFCHTTKTSDGLVADIYMSDTHWEEAKVQVTGIRCRELPKDRVTSTLDTPFGTLSWKPDIELLEDEELCKYTTARSSKSAPTESGRSSWEYHEYDGDMRRSLVQCISQVVDLAAHKNSELSILQIGIGSNSQLSSVLSVLGASSNGTPRFSNFIISDGDAEKVEKCAEIQKLDSMVTLRTLTHNDDLQKQDIKAESIDLIIAVLDFDTIEKKQNFLSNVLASLKAGGTILIYESTKNLSNGLHLTIHVNSGIIPVSIPTPLLDKDEGILSIFRTKRVTKEESLIEIYIPQNPNQNDKAKEISTEIANFLKKSGISTRTIRWPPSLDEIKGKNVISLLELNGPLLGDLSSEDFEILKNVATQCSQLLWVSTGDNPVMGAALGYLRVLRNENPNLVLRYLLLEDGTDRPAREVSNLIIKVALNTGLDSEYAEFDGYLCINRWIADDILTKVTAKDEVSGQPDCMALGKSKAPLKLVHGLPANTAPIYFALDEKSNMSLGDDEVQIEVKAMVLKSPDSSVDSAKEYSGIVRNSGIHCQLKLGERVYFPSLGPYRTTITVQERLCQRIPDHISFEQAASFSLTYATTHQALVRMGHLRLGQSVLIQDAASSIGQVAIHLAKKQSATIFATVKTEEQYALVRSLGVLKDRILREGDQNLAAAVGILSESKGIDTILNSSMTGEALRKLWHCVAPFGSLINVSSDTLNDFGLDMMPFQRGSTFSVLNLDLILKESTDLMANILEDVANSLEATPIQPSAIFPASKIAEAFAFKTSEENYQVVVTLDSHDLIPVSTQARNQLSLDSNSTYLIIGGLGGLGRSLTTLLVENGARHLVLISRSGCTPSSPGDKMIQDLSSKGVSIRVFACDVSDFIAMQNVIAECTLTMPPIRGVIQSAAVLRDAVYDNMTYEQWREATRPKIQGSWNLHTLLPEDLDFFVMLSSISGVVGNRSQANYAAGNTYQDSLAHYRRKRGLAATSVDLGLMIGIGLIAERGGNTNLQKSEAVGINEGEFHALMKAVIGGKFGGRDVPAQVICGLPTGGILQQAGLDAPFYYNDPRFLLLKNKDLLPTTDSNSNSNNQEASLASQLSNASSLEEATGIISFALCEKIAKGLQTTSENIDASKALHTYGIDSLMAVEIRAWVAGNMRSEISLFDVLSGGSIAVLAGRIAKVSKLVREEIVGAA